MADAEGEEPPLVLVWDIDETLIPMQCLLTGAWAGANRLEEGEGGSACKALGARWQRAVLDICDRSFHFAQVPPPRQSDVACSAASACQLAPPFHPHHTTLLLCQVEEHELSSLEEAAAYDDGAPLAGYDWDGDGFPPPLPASPLPPCGRSPEREAAALGLHEAAAEGGGGEASSPPRPHELDGDSLRKLAYRYRWTAKLCSFGLGALGTADARSEWEQLYAATDATTGGWLTAARELLAACSRELGGGGRRVVHRAVTSGQLTPTLAKLLLFKLGGQLPPLSVQSSAACGKLACFMRLREQFGERACLVAIGELGVQLQHTSWFAQRCSHPHCPPHAPGDGPEEDAAARALGWPLVRVLLADAGKYSDAYRERTPPDSTGSLGRPLPELTVEHLACAAATWAPPGAPASS